MAGRKSKYTDELKEQLLWALAETGEARKAIKQVDISEATFYRWLDEKEEFQELVARGKAMFRDKMWQRNPELFSMAVEGLVKHLEGATETWKKVTVKEIPRGKSIQEIKIRSTSEVKRPPAKWAIDRLLGFETEEDHTRSVLDELHEQMQKNYNARHKHD